MENLSISNVNADVTTANFTSGKIAHFMKSLSATMALNRLNHESMNPKPETLNPKP